MEDKNIRHERLHKSEPIEPERAKIMGSKVMLTMGKSDEGAKVMDLLSSRGISFSPFTMSGVREPRITSGGLELEGYEEISTHLDELELSVEED